MKAVQKQTQVVDIANDSKSSEASIEDSGLTVIQESVREAFLKNDRTILTKFLSEMKGILDDSELADYVNQQRDKLGNTALHTCYMMYEQEVVRIEGVFERTRDVFNSQQDRDDLGAEYKKAAIFAGIIKHHLVEAGLDPSIRNLGSQTAIELCIRGRVVMTTLEEGLAEQSHATKLTVVPPSQHASRLDNEPKRKGGCIIV